MTVDLDELLREGAPSQPKHRLVVRLETQAWVGKRGINVHKRLIWMRRLSIGCFNMLEEDADNIGAFEVMEKVTNLNECDDGLYEVVTCNEKRDWETGNVDSYDYLLKKFNNDVDKT